MMIDVLTFLLLQFAMGTASVTPSNATKQPDVYLKGRAASVYCFDLDIYGENSWIQ
jgi:hypothetical protein